MVTDHLQPHPGETGPGLGFEPELTVRAEQVDHLLQPELAEWVLPEPAGHQPLDGVEALLEVAEREDLGAVDLGRQPTVDLGDVGERHGVLHLDPRERRVEPTDPPAQLVGVVLCLRERLRLHRRRTREPQAVTDARPVALHLDHGDAVALVRHHDVDLPVAVVARQPHRRDHQPRVGEAIAQPLDDHPLGVVLQRTHRELGRHQRPHCRRVWPIGGFGGRDGNRPQP